MYDEKGNIVGMNQVSVNALLLPVVSDIPWREMAQPSIHKKPQCILTRT